MRALLRKLKKDARGAAAIEFALVGPTAVLLIMGAIQINSLLYSASQMRTALGDGARFATLYRTSTIVWKGPSAAEICNRMTSGLSRMQKSDIVSMTLTRATNGTAHALDIAVQHNVALDFAFFTQTVALNTNRRVYVRTQPNFASHSCAL